MTYTEARAPIVRHFPQLAELWDRIGGGQVRNAGTVGANIANGSPIGDTPPPLIWRSAHGSRCAGAMTRREVKLKNFFIAYGKQDRQPGEFVESVTIPYLPAGEQLACYKITKRRDEDISALCGAFRVFINDDGVVGMARIAFGGMAATPKRAKAVEEALVGKPWTTATIEAAIPAFATDFTPLTDMRASSGIPAAGGAEPAAAVPSRDHRRGRAAEQGGGMNKMDVVARRETKGGRLHESTPHDSAIKQVAGRAEYVDDLTEPEGTLHAYLGLCDPRACGDRVDRSRRGAQGAGRRRRADG